MLKRGVVGLAVLCLAGLVVYLLSERNARSFGVELKSGELLITRGRMAPFGMQPWAPSDRILAEAYAPIPVIGDSPGSLLLTRFEDRDALDKALFRTLRTWAEPRVEAEDPVRLREAVKLLRRMELLTGISEEQRHQLADIRSRIAWFEGRTELEEALVTLRSAIDKLKLAAESKGRFSKEAGLLFDRIQPLAERLGQQARAASRGESLEPVPELPEPAAEAEVVDVVPTEAPTPTESTEEAEGSSGETAAP